VQTEFAVEACDAIAIVVDVFSARVEGGVPILCGAHVHQTVHPHVDVFDILHMTVEHVRARIVRTIDVSESAVHRHGDRGGRLAIEEGDGVLETVEVHSVGIGQVGAHLQAQVTEFQFELLALPQPEHGCRVLGLHLLVEDLGIVLPGHIAEAEYIGGEDRVGREIIGVIWRDGRGGRQVDPAVGGGKDLVGDLALSQSTHLGKQEVF